MKPSRHPRHTWLEWLGIQEAPPEPDSWVPVVRDIYLDEPETDSSKTASRLVALLGQAGIQAHQRSYEFDSTQMTGAVLSGPRGGMVRRVAVLVLSRDRSRATQIASEFNGEFERERSERERTDDQELTREALEAGPPPEV